MHTYLNLPFRTPGDIDYAIVPRQLVRRHVDAEIATVRIDIDQLHRHQTLLSKQRNYLCDIAQLPPEILSQIFITAAAQEARSNTLIADVPTVVPLLLSHVCSSWRQLAFGLSEIWASFHCRISSKNACRQAELLSQWLCRAGQRLLSVRLSFRNEKAWANTYSTVIIDALTPYSRQWRDLDLVLPYSWQSKIPQVQGAMENLQSLSIHPITPQRVKMFAAAPRLCKIVAWQHDLWYCTLPWLQLTSATIRMSSTLDAWDVLGRCPNLTICHFKKFNSANQFNVIQRKSHYSLEYFELAIDAETEALSVDSMLDVLVLPRLRRLDLVLPTHHDTDDPFSSIEALINRSLCPLTSVNIKGPTISEHSMVDFLFRAECVNRVTNNVAVEDEES